MWYALLLLPALAQEPEVTEADLVISHVFTARWNEKTEKLEVNFWAYRRTASPTVLEYFVPSEVSRQGDVIYFAVPTEFESAFSGLVFDRQENIMYAVGSPYDGVQVTMPVSISSLPPHQLGHIYKISLSNWLTCEGPGCVAAGFGL